MFNGVMSSVSILVVDDVALLVLTYNMVLAQHGFQVKTAQTCADAIATLEHHRFDLMLCDMTLDHGHTGWEVIAAAQRLQPRMKIALMTGFDNGEIRDRARELGLEVLFKPVPVDELIGTVQRMCPVEDDGFGMLLPATA